MFSLVLINILDIYVSKEKFLFKGLYLKKCNRLLNVTGDFFLSPKIIKGEMLNGESPVYLHWAVLTKNRIEKNFKMTFDDDDIVQKKSCLS